MGLSLASNIAALSTQTKLTRTTSQLNDSFARLSSGLRINKAADDPAGLALADSLRADSRIAAVAVRNANDGLSIAAVTDSSLSEIGNILNRMVELATQSSNGVYSTTQRSALSTEFLALGSEIDRIAKATTFNGIALLSGSSAITLQVGFRSDSNSQIILQGVQGTLSALGLSGNAGGGILTYSIIDSTSIGAQAAALAAVSAVTNAITSLTTIRGIVGASQSRLTSAVNYLQAVRENFIAAESHIRDLDVAQEVSRMVRLQVLQKAQTAIAAQANQQPSLVLDLLH